MRDSDVCDVPLSVVLMHSTAGDVLTYSWMLSAKCYPTLRLTGKDITVSAVHMLD